MSEQGQGRVLIVDDQREVARALRTMLTVEHPDWYVADVPSGEEALLDLAADRYDAIVVDFRLPGISGRDLLLRVRSVAPAVRIVFMSGYELDRIRRDLGDLDVAAVLQKPLDMDEFLGVVGDAVEAAARERAAGEEGQDDPAAAVDSAERRRARLEGMIAALRADLDAQTAALVDLAGEPAMADGPLYEVPQLSRLAKALAGHFDTLAEVEESVGRPVEATHTYRGAAYDVYALSAGPEFFVMLVYPGGGPERLRAVMRHGRPAVDALSRVLSEMLGLEMPEPAPEPPAAPEEDIDTGLLPEFQPEPDLPPSPPVLEPPLPPEPPDPEPKPDPPIDPAVAMSLLDEGVAPLDIDLEGLEFDLDAADTDSLEAFWEEAGGGPAGIDGEAMTHDEAVRRGLIPEDVDLDDEE